MSLPHTSRIRRVVAVLVAGLACTLIAVQGAQAKDPLTRQQHQLERQMRSAQALFDDASSAVSAARSALDKAQKRLSAADKLLAATRVALAAAAKQDDLMRARLKVADEQWKAAQDAVTAARVQVAQQRDAIGAFAAQTFQQGDPQLMQILTVMESGSAGEISGRLGVIDSIAAKQSGLLAQYREDLAGLAATERSVAAATAQVAVQQQETAAAVAARQKLAAAALKQQRTVAYLVKTRRAAQARAVAAMRRDLVKLALLRRKDASIKAQILARKRHDRNRMWRGHGMLLRPVDGPITSPFGWRIHPIYHYWGLHDGDDFAAPCGSPQFAADNGTVISEYYSDVWGNRLYIDLGNINGHNYTVIHNHLSRYAVWVGQHVRRGQVVAYTGTTGWSTGCHLHFTVLRDGVAVNPARYF